MATIRHRSVNILPIDTALGVFQVGYSDKGLVSLCFPKQKAPTRSKTSRAGNSLPSFMDTFVNELRDYAFGKKIKFQIPVEFISGTEFQKTVWRALKQIPHGKVRSYASVAQKIGNPNAARAVGTACGANPIPVVIPCHRVVPADGHLGGYSAGIKWKKRLLDIEKVEI